METVRLDSISTLTMAYALPLLWKVLGAIVLWVVGAFVIRAVLGAVNRVLLAKGLDSTLRAYAASGLGILFKLFLILAILSVFGIETTSFAALLAAGGVAIGMAWAGLLSNFAAGVFLMVLRPFKAGDMISAAGLTGVVKEIGLFATTIETGDNLVAYAGNNKIFSDNIVNYSQNPVRRVDRTAQLAHGVDAADAKRRILAKLAAIPMSRAYRRRRSRCSTSTRRARCSPFVRRATTTTTGMSTSRPTRRSRRRVTRGATQSPNNGRRRVSSSESASCQSARSSHSRRIGLKMSSWNVSSSASA